MKKTYTKSFFIYLAVILTGFILFGCGAKKIPMWGDEKAGFNLQYQLDNGQKLNYETASKSNQYYEIMNQKQSEDSDISISFTLAGSQTDKPDQLIGQVTVDDMKMKTTQTAMGETAELERDLSKVIGKSFTLGFSPSGDETDYTGIEKLTIDMGPMAGGERSIQENFSNILPDLPDNPVKIGETWTSVFEESYPAMGTTTIKRNTVSKIEGYETVNGYECLKINSEITGTLDIAGKVMNIDFTLKGDIKGVSTWYFAYKKGLLIKSSANSTIDGKLGIGGEQGMSGPIKIKGTDGINLTTPAL